MIQVYHDRGIDSAKLGCRLPNLPNICLQSSTTASFYQFPEGDKDLIEKMEEDMVGGPSIISMQKAVVGETNI